MSSITSPMLGVLDAVLPAALLAGAGDQVVLVALVAGVDVDGDEREGDRRALPQHVEDLQQRPAVLAAGQPDHDAVAVLDQTVFGDRLGDLLGDACFEWRLCRTWLLADNSTYVSCLDRRPPRSAVADAASAAVPIRSASAVIVDHVDGAPRRARRASGSQTKPVTPSSTSSAGPPLSRHVITALRDANASTVTKP